jgi:putative PIG3 family NAD(P)H quinone oxidoreductase
MWAVTLPTFGGPEALVWQEVGDPSVQPGQVVVDVRAAGLNRADLLQRQGRYPPPPGSSDLPGLECSGVISELGPDVTDPTRDAVGSTAGHWQPGEQVCALLAGGGYATRVAVPIGQLLPVPAGVSLVEAAALPEAACTVWSTVFAAAHLQAGETLLVHGGTSGIGTFAIQLARACGIRVLTTAGSPDKCKRAEAIGAAVAINYRSSDFVSAVREDTSGRGVDVILDIVGGDYLARNLDALAPDGRLVVLATQHGRRAELDLGTVMAKRATIYSAGLRARPQPQKAAIVAAVRQHVWPLIESGAIRPVIDSVFAMADASAAHRRLEDGDHVGKVLLTSPGAGLRQSKDERELHRQRPARAL